MPEAEGSCDTSILVEYRRDCFIFRDPWTKRLNTDILTSNSGKSLTSLKSGIS
jgi:viroplasmin and RNaseH domain-containing protein